jgi:hypothetical protein
MGLVRRKKPAFRAQPGPMIGKNPRKTPNWAGFLDFFRSFERFLGPQTPPSR